MAPVEEKNNSGVAPTVLPFAGIEKEKIEIEDEESGSNQSD